MSFHIFFIDDKFYIQFNSILLLSIKTPIIEQYNHDFMRHYDFNDYKINM